MLLFISCLNNFRFSKVHLTTIDIATKMMEPDHCTISTSNDFVDGPTSIKEEPVDDDGPQSEEQLAYQHLKNHRPIINIAPIVTSGDCVSNPGEDNLTVKSEPYFNHNATETSTHTAVKGNNITPKLYDVKNESPCPIHTAVKSEVVTKTLLKIYEVKNESPCPIHTAVKSEAITNITSKLCEVKNESPCPIHTAVKSEVVSNISPKLCDVKNESPCSTHTKIVHNNIDADSELVEVSGELDCKPEIIDNVNSVDVLGDVNIQTSVQHNDTVNHKPLLTSMNNCEVDLKDTTDLGK